MRRERMFLCLLALLLLLTACGKTSDDQPTEQAAVPSRMVERIDITIHPTDDKLARAYTDMEKMSPILRILRDMDTDNKPADEPNLTDGQTYYTITTTYASGETKVYFLLSHQFLRINDGGWYEVDTNDAMDLIQYIRQTPDTADETEPESSEADETSEISESAEETDPSEETNASA